MSKLLAGVTLEKDDYFDNYYFRFNGGAKRKAKMMLLWELLHNSEPGRIPEGWKLVPVEPTGAMRREWERTQLRSFNVEAGATWRAMLAASPEPDSGEGKGKPHIAFGDWPEDQTDSGEGDD